MEEQVMFILTWLLVNLRCLPLQREALHTCAFRIPLIGWIGNCLRSTLALLFRSEIFWVFSLDDQIFRDVVWVLLHPNHCALLKRNAFLDQLCIKMLLAWASWNRWTHSLTLTLNCSSVSLPWFRYLLASILCTWWGLAVLFRSLATRLNKEHLS